MNRRQFLTGGLAALIGLTSEDADAKKRKRSRQHHPKQMHQPAQPSYPAQAPQSHLQNRIESNILTVYYPTNDWRLYDNDQMDLRTFLACNRDKGLFIIEGFCDERGSSEDNLQLGQHRADGVETFLRQSGYKGEIRTVSHGETDPAVQDHDKRAYRYNRRVTIVPDQEIISRALSLSPADYYLADSSGSMAGEKWRAVEKFNYPKNAALYTFSDRMVRVDKFDDRAYLGQGTELWHSVYSLLNQMGVNKRLTVLTDGADNSGKGAPPKLIQAAQAKQIKVSTIGIGVDGHTKKSLVQLAKETGGGFYIASYAP